MNNRRRSVIALLTVMLLGGCAVEPVPLSPGEIQERVAKDLGRLFEGQPPVQAPITLEEAVKRAVEFNLDHRVKLMEEALANGQLELGFYSMLPRLSASASRTHRSEYSATWSESLTNPGQESLEMSISQEKRRNLADAGLVWNLLDFGVSYLQERQFANEVLIANLRRQKAMQDITRDVRNAYWRAVSAEVLLPQIESLLKKTESALEKSRKQEKLKEPEKAMEFQDELLQRLRQLVAIRREMAEARNQLASLMNLRPGSSFKIDTQAYKKLEVPKLNLKVDELESIALLSRPELMEEDYKERISADEVHKAMVRMLPGIEINLTHNYDSNKYSYRNNWNDIAGKVMLNISEILQGPASIRQAEAEKELAVTRRLAMSIAVLTQVHVSEERFHMNLKDYQLAEEYLQVKERRSKRAQAAKKAQGGDEIDVIRQESGEVLARLQRDMAYAELQNAFGMVINSLGKGTLEPMAEPPKGAALTNAARVDEIAHLVPETLTNTQESALVSATKVQASGPEKGSQQAVVLPNKQEKQQPVIKSSTGVFSVQVAAFSTEGPARELASRLQSEGMPARFGYRTASLQKQNWWVRLGPFPSRSLAEQMANDWKSRTQDGDAFIL